MDDEQGKRIGSGAAVKREKEEREKEILEKEEGVGFCAFTSRSGERARQNASLPCVASAFR